ncbi:MAG: aminopeptidase, partial [Bacteroidales bacterium]|nr:aminopeptidase [Bacteroidales bacterium]
ELADLLRSIDGVVSVEELSTTKFFSEKYLIIFEQKVDVFNADSKTFHQRVFLNHKSFNSPVVYTTEGYSADYAANKNYINELCSILNANEICVEHRYFSESKPEDLDWQFLTTKSAADDHHFIREALGKLYKGKWVSTGISKGGQTCLLYQMYYPNDVDACVAYVAPIAKALVDGRHEQFLNNVARKKERQKITNFQLEILKRRETIFPMFEQFCKISKLSFNLPLEEIYDYCVLEYSFAFWQWVGDTERIPLKKETDSKLFQHWIAVSGPDYFSIEGSEASLPFFYQAARELGYYGYETTKFEKFLKIKSAKNYFKKIFLTADMNPEFYSQTSIDLEKFVQTKAKNTILIYGEYDPWTAVAPETTNTADVVKFIKPKGTHSTRIKNMPKIQHDMIINLLNSFVE